MSAWKRINVNILAFSNKAQWCFLWFLKAPLALVILKSSSTTALGSWSGSISRADEALNIDKLGAPPEVVALILW